MESDVFIPYAMTYSASAKGSVIKDVRCEHCGCDFVYKMDRRGSDTAKSFLFLNNNGAKKRAQRRALADLDEQLTQGSDPIPCPKCLRYQVDMIKSMRENFHSWAFWLGIILLVIALPMLGIDWL